MKYGIFGDMHGTSLGKLERRLEKECVEVVICLGDFDQVRTLKNFIELERKFLARGGGVIKVPGNHDHEILKEGSIFSETLRRQGKNTHCLHREFKNDPVALAYLEKLVDSDHKVVLNLDEKRFGKKYRTIVVHGGFGVGDLSGWPDCPSKVKDLWDRLSYTWNYRENFKAMVKKSHRIMIRGHDHDPIYSYLDGNKPSILRAEPGSSFKLLKDRRHIINPGALFDGCFAIIDTSYLKEECPILIYYRL